MIQPGHENLVHHILLYQCDSNLSEEELEHGHECYHPNMPDSFNTCQAIFFAWAIGGEVLPTSCFRSILLPVSWLFFFFVGQNISQINICVFL